LAQSHTKGFVSGGDESHRRKKCSDSPRIAREQWKMGDVGVRPDEEVRQRTRLFAARPPVFFKCFPRLKRGVKRKWQISEGGKPMFQFLLGVKFHRQLSENHGFIGHGALTGRALELGAGSWEPVRVLGENVGNDAGIDQIHPRVSRNQSLVRPLILPPRSNVVRARLPR